VLATLLVVVGIAVVDSINPTTIGPALLLTMSKRPVVSVLEFAAGYFAVNVLGGLLLVFGPGQLLLTLLPHPSAHRKHVLELVGGLVLLVAAAVLWVARGRLASSGLDEGSLAERRGPAFLTGAGIALAELPTAFPYFAAIAAIVAADPGFVTRIALVVIFNVVFLAPVLAIAVSIRLFPSVHGKVLDPLRRWLTREWPRLLASIVAAAGLALTAVGAVGLAV
jgi:cytochrome c biogenesis protein CcdA